MFNAEMKYFKIVIQTETQETIFALKFISGNSSHLWQWVSSFPKAVICYGRIILFFFFCNSKFAGEVQWLDPNQPGDNVNPNFFRECSALQHSVQNSKEDIILQDKALIIRKETWTDEYVITCNASCEFMATD